MDVNKIQIRKDGITNKELVIPIQLTWDYLGLDQSIDEYETEVINQVTGRYGDFEVTRFAHAPVAVSDPYSDNAFEYTDIQYEFNFYSGGSLSDSSNWRNTYISEGFTPNEIYYYTNNFTNSFFKLDLYDTKDDATQKNYLTVIIPVQQGATQSGQVLTPTLPTVSIKRPQFTLDFLGDKEGYFLYWLRSTEYINIDTLYMKAKFFNGKTGSYVVMTNTPQNLILPTPYNFDPTVYFYYEVNFDYNDFTYTILDNNGNRIGTNNPINSYEYINP